MDYTHLLNQLLKFLHANEVFCLHHLSYHLLSMGGSVVEPGALKPPVDDGI